MRTTIDQGFPYLVVGIGLGLLAGLLWAPRAGHEMRDELRRGADDGLKFLNQEGNKVRAGADRWFGKISEYFAGDKTQGGGGLREQTHRLE